MLAIPGIGPLLTAHSLAATARSWWRGGRGTGALTDIGISEADAPISHGAVVRCNVAQTVRFAEEGQAEMTAALAKVREVGVRDLRSLHGQAACLFFSN